MKRLVLAALLFAATAHATIFETFSGASFLLPTSTGVWNRAKQWLAPAFYIPADPTAQLGSNTPVDIGDGSDGAFDASTLASFDVNGGSGLTGGTGTLTLSTGTILTPRSYNFTTFTIPAGVTVKCTGANPLVIRVQGDAEIFGTLTVAGAPGSGGVGGVGRCGGGHGGDGGPAGGSYTDGTAGTSPGPLTIAGAGSDQLNTTYGGRGGKWVVGVIYPWPLQGGAGGGGGAGGPGGPGGAGGAGGGALQLNIGGDFLVHASANVSANGGDGETSPEGGGAGGAGGGLVIFVEGSFTNPVPPEAGGVYNTLHTNYGLGTNSLSFQGEQGDDGRNWQVNFHEPTDLNYDNIAVPLTAHTPPTEGAIVPVPGANVFESQFYDTGENSPVYQIPEIVDNGAGIRTYEFSGSSNPATDPGTAFVSGANISQLDGKRFLKFRLSLEATTATVPRVTSVRVSTAEHDFLVSLGGCARVSRPRSGGGASLALVLLAYLFSLPAVTRAVTRV